jgi:5-methylcytosine-specific restriction endonuclease McrA
MSEGIIIYVGFAALLGWIVFQCVSSYRSERAWREWRRAGGAVAPAAVRERISPAVRGIVWRRDGGQCVRCGSVEKLELGHIIPWSLGGSDTEENIQLLCQWHNRSEGNRI